MLDIKSLVCLKKTPNKCQSANTNGKKNKSASIKIKKKLTRVFP